jgi:low molecular weight protein-tyrosine phosphatase
MHTILFLCTGNYYRSRFAELLFNALAVEAGLPWQASSRGVAIEKGVNNTGPISRTVVQTLRDLGIDVEVAARYPMQVQENELQQADVIIALQEAEHRPYLRARYPAWVEEVEYWHVRDMDPTPAYNPLQEIATEVRRLILRLSDAEPMA